MKPVRVLIADDQSGMRMILRMVLEKRPEFLLVGEAEDGRQALELYEKERPELVFLDVEMPELDGLECARQIFDLDPRVFLIFATAHEQYMKQAFQVYAFDYLMKPFKLERINETLDRLLDRVRLRQTPGGEASPPAPSASPSRLLVKGKDRISLVDTRDIILISRTERSTCLHTATESIPMRETLNELMEKLDPNLFFRSHKSYIINLSMVSGLYPYGRWSYLVKFKGTDQDALMTCERFAEMEKRL